MRKIVVPSLTIVLLCWAALLLITGCGGIDPDAIRPFTGLRGTIRYIGGKNSWPKDSIYDLRVVAFEKKPKLREDVVSAVVQQTAAFSPVMLPTFEDSTLYVLEVLGTPRTFEYVVVAMQNGPSFLTDWLMLDVYAPTGDPTQPGRIVVPSGGTINLDFRVGFDSLPPQPFP
ncbi:MAG: hypothetical protein ACKOE4_03945 [Candidatus Kapaibacterium sp.]